MLYILLEIYLYVCNILLEKLNLNRSIIQLVL